VAQAWEGATTHAGLAEQAATSSRLHDRLVALGFSLGLYEGLTVPPGDASGLVAILRQMPPTQGFVPDARGRQYAIHWLAAGAAIADVPPSHAVHHFFDPESKRGFSAPDLGSGQRWKMRLAGAFPPGSGMAAPDWVISDKNPLGLHGFLDQYEKAVTSTSAAERGRHMAGALVAAGAILHVLADAGVPSRVRSDAAAHFEDLDAGAPQFSSRLERIAALAYGRLGVPAPQRVVTRPRIAEFFGGNAEQPGLATWTSSHWFSPGTLPYPIDLRSSAQPRVRRATPAPAGPISHIAANQAQGATLRSAGGTCLARYHADRDRVQFSIDDDCALEQLAIILPEVAAYSAGMLDHLLRGELLVDLRGDSAVIKARSSLGPGQYQLLVESADGTRKVVASGKTTSVAADVLVAEAHLASRGVRVVAVFRGVDAAGEPVVAVGSRAIQP
jgi:hypothetical protein